MKALDFGKRKNHVLCGEKVCRRVCMGKAKLEPSSTNSQGGLG